MNSFWKVERNLLVIFGDLVECYFWAFGNFWLTVGKLGATFKILPKSYRNSKSNFPKVAKGFQFYFQILTKSPPKSLKVFQMLPKSSKSFPKVVQSLKIRFQRLPNVTPNIKLPTSPPRHHFKKFALQNGSVPRDRIAEGGNDGGVFPVAKYWGRRNSLMGSRNSGSRQ